MKNIKANAIRGNKIFFRNAIINDAEFILSLRTSESKSKFISKTEFDVMKQRQWLEEYSLDNTQAYFIILDNESKNIGTVRIYDIEGDSFCWGSWILAQNAPSSAAIESALIIYSYALELGFRQAHFDVRKGNHSVCRFHERFGAVKISESELDNFYTIDINQIESSLLKYKKYLPEGIVINR